MGFVAPKATLALKLLTLVFTGRSGAAARRLTATLPPGWPGTVTPPSPGRGIQPVMPGDQSALGDREVAGWQRDGDATTGRHARAPRAIVGFLRVVSRAAGVAGSTACFGRKPRQAVPEAGALEEAGPARHRSEPKRPGRGNLGYTVAMADADRADAQETYLSLCRLLLAVLADGHDPGEAGRAAGMLIGKAARSNDSSTPDDTLAQLEKFLQSRGFMPKQIGGGTGFELGRCPYEQAALVNPGLVCGLHRALAEGMLEALGGTYEVANLVPRHPTTAGCRLELRAAGRRD